MDKEFGNIKITETDDGYKIDIKGKDLKNVLSKCCGNMMVSCCQPAGQENAKQ
ncbi:MAG: hypothetical protein GY855_00520 [candidate division Zixibacteria bacterium]|nr:hypothetical protein [candidate division Zixibacteria bacterium]